MKNTTDKFKEIAARLNHYKKTNPAPPLDPYEGAGRHTYCHLVLFHEDKVHLFQVRGFTALKTKIKVNGVNWTMTTGTCQFDLTRAAIREYKIEILEDCPSIQTLYGY
jgi:hypothetical protein